MIGSELASLLCKRFQKHKGIGGVRISQSSVSFSPGPAYDYVAHDLVRTRLSESEAEAKGLTNDMAFSSVLCSLSLFQALR